MCWPNLTKWVHHVKNFPLLCVGVFKILGCVPHFLAIHARDSKNVFSLRAPKLHAQRKSRIERPVRKKRTGESAEALLSSCEVRAYEEAWKHEVTGGQQNELKKRRAGKERDSC